MTENIIKLINKAQGKNISYSEMIHSQTKLSNYINIKIVKEQKKKGKKPILPKFLFEENKKIKKEEDFLLDIIKKRNIISEKCKVFKEKN